MRKGYIFVILFFLLFGFTGYKLTKLTNATDLSDSSEIKVNIPEGSSSKQITNILKENGLIKNEIAFNLKIKQSKIGNKIQSGNYTLTKSMDMNQIIETLKDGPDRETIRFTIPEGFELKQIAQRLSEKELVDKDRFLELVKDKSNFQEEFTFLKQLEAGESLEGFLFPATYEVYITETEEDIIKRMLSAFNNIYVNEIEPRMDKTSLNFNEIITLASIIEREGKLDEERPLMSAVFYNRIDKGIKLQSCATVQYIIGERKEILTNKDTSTPSPYNTYLHEGLPPAPIAAPGKTSIIAALEPADVDYLYFVLTGSDGSHTFTTNYNDHLKAKSKGI